MKHYKDSSNNIYAFAADGSQDAFIKPGLTPISDAELVALRQPTLPEARTAKLAQLEAARDAAEQADVTVQGKQFSASQGIADRFEKLSARLRRGKPTALSAIFTVDGTPVSPVTPQLLGQIEDAIAANGEAAWNRYGQLVGQVMAATTVEQVQAISW